MIKRNTQAGFGIVGIVVVIVVLGIIGGLGWVAYNNFVQKPAAKTQSTASSDEKKPSTPAMTANPYAGWKTATLVNERITYQYPADWTLTDRSTHTPKGTGGCVYPGVDNIVLTSPSQHQVALMTGVACIGSTGAKTFDSIPVTALGQKMYITLAAAADRSSNNLPSSPTSACLSPVSDQIEYPAGIRSKNIFVDGSSDAPFSDFCYYPYAYYTNPNATDPKFSVVNMEDSADFAIVKLIFESLKYQ